jgi:hypothetical protein
METTHRINFKNDLTCIETSAIAVNLANMLGSAGRVIDRTGFPVASGIIDLFGLSKGGYIRIFNTFSTITIETDILFKSEDIQDAFMYATGYHVEVETF